MQRFETNSRKPSNFEVTVNRVSSQTLPMEVQLLFALSGIYLMDSLRA